MTERPSVLFYWHDIWLPHSRFLLEALNAWSDVKEITVCGPAVRRSAASVFMAPEGDVIERESSAYQVRMRSYRRRETICTFREWRRVISQKRPDILIICDEALSPNVLLAGIANWLWGRGVVLFYGFENIVQRVGWCEVWAGRSGIGVRALLGRLLRRTVFDLLLMPIRRALVHGGLISYAECGDVVHSYRWQPPMTIQWWPVNGRAFTPRGPKATFGIEAKFTVGFVGRFVPEKGILDLLRAVAQLDRHIGLVLIGDGPDKARIELEIEQLGVQDRCAVLPPQNAESLASSYRAMDLVVLPSKPTLSWKEQYGRVLVEARLSGTRTAGSDVGAIPTVVGDPAMIFPSGDVAAIARTILRAESRLGVRSEELPAVTPSAFLAAWLNLARSCAHPEGAAARHDETGS